MLALLMNSGEYIATIEQIKREIQEAQYKAAVHVNADLILLYHSIGCVINEHKTWGNKFIDNLAADIRLTFPNSTGYSVRNLKVHVQVCKCISRPQICADDVCTNSMVP